MLSMELLMGACYLTGAVIYSAAIPEKWMPGMFDTWAHSHNIFHVLVVCGVYAHYRAALSLMAWRDHHGCETDVTLLKRWYIDNGWIGYMLPGGWMEYAQSAMGAAVHEELRLQMSAGSSDEQRTTAAICRAVYQVIGRVSLSG